MSLRTSWLSRVECHCGCAATGDYSPLQLQEPLSPLDGNGAPPEVACVSRPASRIAPPPAISEAVDTLEGLARDAELQLVATLGAAHRHVR